MKVYQNFWLWGELVGSGAEWIDIGLPTPSLFVKTNFGAYIGWLIEGYFATERNKQFLRDVTKRMEATFALENARWRWLPFPPKNPPKVDFAYNLRDDIAPALQSLQASKSADAVEYLAQHSFCLSDRVTDDALFDAIRFRVYDFCNANSVEALTYDYVEMVAIDEYEKIGSKKGISTAKAKARAIYRWVKANYHKGSNYIRKTKDDKELKMTRRENITRINKLRAIDRRKKVEKAVESLQFLGERISVRNVAKYAGVSINTARKYLAELRN